MGADFTTTEIDDDRSNQPRHGSSAWNRSSIRILTIVLTCVFLHAATATTAQEQDSSATPSQIAEAENSDEDPAVVQQRAREKLATIQFPNKEFTFVRVKYSSAAQRRGGGWATDYPDADLALSKRLGELTSLQVNPDPLVLEFTDKRLSDYPFIYMAEPGRLHLSDQEATSLRNYLTAGGFLMADDFWGEAEWQNVMSQMLRVFPKLKFVDLPLSHPIFHSVYDLKEKPQVCSIAAAIQGRRHGVTWERSDANEVHYRGLVAEDGRLMAVFCHNTDLADGWERHDVDEWYSREFSEKRAFPMGINLVVYALTR